MQYVNLSKHALGYSFSTHSFNREGGREKEGERKRERIGQRTLAFSLNE
jgi:hypothetical protein